MTLPAATTVFPVGGPVASQRDSRFPLRGSTGCPRVRLVNRPFAALAFVMLAVPAHAEIFRCTSDGGAITFQEIPCPPSTQAATMDIPSRFPEVNRVERERLLAREAALDARLLKRAEIDAAERIARDDRLAREREIAALREELARREAEQAAGGFFVVQPLRPPRVHIRLDRRVPNWRPS